MQAAGVGAWTTLSYKLAEESAEVVELMRLMDEIYMKDPWMRSRRLVALRAESEVAIFREAARLAWAEDISDSRANWES